MNKDEAQQRLMIKLQTELGPVWFEDDKLAVEWNLVQLILNDPLLIEIMINPDGRVWIERQGEPMIHVGYKSPTEIELALGTIAASMDRVINRASPIIEGELPIGNCRVQGMLPPLVSGPAMTIRVPAKHIYTLDQYVTAGIVTDRAADYLRGAVAERKNILIVGGTQSGKTTLANALIHEIDPADRCVLIEDTRELQCRVANFVQMHTSVEFDLRKLVRSTMRMRPDRIIIGEVRGAEALELLKAWNTGHPGGITTMHANDNRQALWKLDTFVAEAGVPPQRELIGQAIQLAVFIQKTPTSRRIAEMHIVNGYNGADFDLTPVM